MDLRVKRTRKNIINAFLELRSKKALEKITIKELSELAMINKATFYLHFKDIYDLSDYLENDLLESIIKELSHPEYCFNNTNEFVKELTNAYISQSSLINIIFSNEQRNNLAYKIEKSIKNFIYEKYPEYKDDAIKNILLTFSIHGSYNAVMNNSNYDVDTVISVIGQAANSIQQLYITKDKINCQK